MSSVAVAVLLALVLLLTAGLVSVLRHPRRQRGYPEALAALASERGLTYEQRDDGQARLLGYPFGIGRDQRAENVLEGELDERHVTAFDYSFRVAGPAGLWLIRRFGVVVVGLPAALPEMEIVEEGPDEKPTTFLGLDFVVTQDADFNERFRVRAADKELAGQVLTPWTQEALMGRPSLGMRMMGAEATSWKRGRLAPGDLDRHLGTLAALVDGIPPTVWIDYRRSA